MALSARHPIRGDRTGSEGTGGPRRGRSKGKAIAAVILLVLLAFLAYATYWGLDWYRMQPKEVEVEPGDLGVEEYKLSGNQSDIVSRMGYPDSFCIMFFEDEANDNATGVDSLENYRFETWTYYSRSREYNFLNGELVSENSTDISPGNLAENPYRPEQFTEYMTLEEIVSSAEIETYVVAPMEEALVEDGEVFYADRLAFGLVQDELLYVESIALEVGE